MNEKDDNDHAPPASCVADLCDGGRTVIEIESFKDLDLDWVFLR